MSNRLKEYINDAIEEARGELKDNLAKCTEKQQLFFKRMYAHGDLEKPINDIVDGIKDDKLDCAMQVVDKTLIKNIKKQTS